MRKIVPVTMFSGREPARLSVLQKWVLENAVTEIEMSEQQFWNFVSVQPVAEKPWTTYMGRLLHVSDMPTDSQKCLGLFDKRTPGTILVSAVSDICFAYRAAGHASPRL